MLNLASSEEDRFGFAAVDAEGMVSAEATAVLDGAESSAPGMSFSRATPAAGQAGLALAFDGSGEQLATLAPLSAHGVGT
eukprot:1631367-Pyramimonas_sp.AAC.1